MLNNGIDSEIPNLFKLDFSLWRRNKIEKANNETDESLFEELYSAFMKLDGVVEIKPKEGVVYDWEEDRPIMTNTSFPKFFKWLGTKV